MKENKRIVNVNCEFAISPRLTMERFEEMLLTLLQVYGEQIGLDIINVNLKSDFEVEETK